MTDSESFDSWDPAVYHRFRAERRAPFDDLVALVAPIPGGRLVDLGCGSGELTDSARRTLSAEVAVGIDSSSAMLSAAAELSAPRLSFADGDIGAFDDPGAWDVVIANASLQWVGDHPAVLARWRRSLCAGGQLAVQVPANPDHPSHTTISEVLAEEPFATAVPGGSPDPVASVLDPARYAEVLWSLGATDQLVRLQVYGMELPSAADVVRWTSGTALVRVKRLLDGPMFDQFVDRYRERLVDHLDHAAPYFYAFKRILMWARFDDRDSLAL